MLLIRNAEIIDPGRLHSPPGSVFDLRIRDARVAEIGRALSAKGERVIDAEGGALVPGLHDHHIHLFALAAARESVQCGPPAVREIGELTDALHQADANLRGSGEQRWIRGVGYHESVAGDLDAALLDRIVPERPLRVQHRGGMVWTVNSAGARLLRLEREGDLAGVERDAEGRPTGRLFRLDDWLAVRVGEREVPDIASTSRELAGFGVTGITDASYSNSAAVMDRFRALQREGTLLQRVRLMGDESLSERLWSDPADAAAMRNLEIGELKILLDETALPEYAFLCTRIARAHAARRAVALHCVTTAELVCGVNALLETGILDGDRIEHASEMSGQILALLMSSGITIVTQPNFIRERGDRYRMDVEASLLSSLYRVGSLIDAGVPLAAGTDAPYGEPNPWLAMWAAVERRTPTGATLGAAERVTPEQALLLFTGTAAKPGSSARSISLGTEADLCLLQGRWSETRLDLASAKVSLAIRGGSVIYET